jgi:hypothetical protein
MSDRDKNQNYNGESIAILGLGLLWIVQSPARVAGFIFVLFLCYLFPAHKTVTQWDSCGMNMWKDTVTGEITEHNRRDGCVPTEDPLPGQTPTPVVNNMVTAPRNLPAQKTPDLPVAPTLPPGYTVPVLTETVCKNENNAVSCTTTSSAGGRAGATVSVTQ